MAEDSSAQEKTEEATPHRIQKAREKGQIARSKELVTTAMLIFSAVLFLIFGEMMLESSKELMSRGLLINPSYLNDSRMIFQLVELFVNYLISMIPLFVVLIVVAIFSSIALGGYVFSWEAVAPKISKLNPISGFGRMFGPKGFMELVKALLKAILVSVFAWFFLYIYMDDIFKISNLPFETAIEEGLYMLGILFILLSSSMLLVTLIDVPFQLYNTAKELRMSMQDIKDEYKEIEGKPEVKQKRRQLQMKYAQGRMLQDVKDADVIITNPTHYAVAVKYDQENDEAPIVLAKGVDYLAASIRTIAAANDVYIVEAPPLARSLYHHVEVQEEVPHQLFIAVAKVLAYVYQLKAYEAGMGIKPTLDNNLNIPAEMEK